MLEAYFQDQSLRALAAQLPTEAQKVKQELSGSLDEEAPNARALFTLAQCHLLDGETTEAKNVLEALVAHDATHVAAKTELAKLCFKDNEPQEAARLLREVTSSRPEVAETWTLLTEYLKQDGRTEASQDALKQFDMITAFNTRLHAAHQAFSNGDFQAADSACRQLLQLVPNEVRTLRLLARIARQFNHHEFSSQTLARCIETRPGDASLGLEYAYSLLGSRKFQEALKECERLIELAPEMIEIYDLKAEVLYHLGQYDDAIKVYRELAQVPENRGPRLVYLGIALKTVGETAEATDIYHEAINIEPNLGRAYWELSNLRTYRFSDEEVAAMRGLLESGKISDLDKVLIEFALGKALEDARQFEESFKHYQAANSAYTKLRPFNYSSLNDRFMSQFTAEHFASRKGQGNDSDAPIFVVGLPRSGSTLLEQIFSSHSLVDATQELDEIVSIARDINNPGAAPDAQYPQSVANLTADQIADLAQRYLDYVRPYRQGAPYFVDKAPHNFQHIGLIKTLFPKAKIIDIRRHPMASGWSLYRQLFADSFQFSYDLETIGKFYNDYVKLMDYWHSVLPGEILTIRYEDLVNDLSATVGSVLGYCGLSPEEACLDFHLNKRAVATPSSEQVRQPLYSDAMEHWKNYEAFLGPLKQTIEHEEPSETA